MILGEIIKEYRTENGMSMDQFAQRSGLSKAYVSVLERNYNPVNGKPVVPSLETIKAVSLAIGKDFNDVIALLDGNQPVRLKEAAQMTTGERIKSRRKELSMSAEQLAEKVGLSPATIYRYENGEIEKVPADILKKIARVLNSSPACLMGWEPENKPSIPSGFQPLPQMDRVPRVGRIACGEPILAEENIEGYDRVPHKWNADFTLICKGDSMAPKIKDGDIVAIHSQPSVENGEIAAVLIETEATLKRVFLFKDHIELRAENPSFPSIVLIGEDMNQVIIEGKAVGLCRDL